MPGCLLKLLLKATFESLATGLADFICIATRDNFSVIKNMTIFRCPIIYNDFGTINFGRAIPQPQSFAICSAYTKCRAILAPACSF